MRIIRGTAPGALRLAGRGQELSGEARRRLKWMDYYESHRHNARLTCRHFDISPQTFTAGVAATTRGNWQRWRIALAALTGCVSLHGAPS